MKSKSLEYAKKMAFDGMRHFVGIHSEAYFEKFSQCFENVYANGGNYSRIWGQSMRSLLEALTDFLNVLSHERTQNLYWIEQYEKYLSKLSACAATFPNCKFNRNINRCTRYYRLGHAKKMFDRDSFSYCFLSCIADYDHHLQIPTHSYANINPETYGFSELIWACLKILVALQNDEAKDRGIKLLEDIYYGKTSECLYYFDVNLPPLLPTHILEGRLTGSIAYKTWYGIGFLDIYFLSAIINRAREFYGLNLYSYAV